MSTPTDELKPENKIVSSLTDDELYILFNEADEGNFYHNKCELREIANAAAQRAIEDLKAPPCDWVRSNMPEEWLDFDEVVKILVLYLQDLKSGKLP